MIKRNFKNYVSPYIITISLTDKKMLCASATSASVSIDNVAENNDYQNTDWL